MTFLAPALLAIGAAVVVPLVLHLSRRDRRPRVVFPALRYLQRAESANARRIRFRQLLLLAARVLAVVLLAAAAARPFLPLGGQGHPPTSVVIILDNSLSTAAVVGDRRVLDELKDGARATLEAAGPGDRFWLVRAGQPWEPAVSGSVSEVARAVEGTVSSGGGADLVAAVGRAAAILATEPESRPTEIHLLSDLQAPGFGGPPAGAVGRQGTPPLRILRGAVPQGNKGLVGLEVGGGLAPRQGQPSTITATLHVSGSTADTSAIRLVLDGSVVDVATAAEGEAAALRFAGRPAGWVTGHVELDPDGLSADDRRYFAFLVEPPPAVATADRLPFLHAALDVLEDNGRIRQVPLSTADVVFAPAGRGAVAVRNNAAVVVLPPNSPLELTAANRRLETAGIPWRFEAPRTGSARFAGDDDRLGPLNDVQLRQVYGLTSARPSADTTLMRISNGDPWAVAGDAEKGRYVMVASPLTEAGGTLPTSTAMIPLLDRLITEWARRGTLAVDHRPGDLLRLEGDSVAGPDGRTEPLTSEQYRLLQPGLYHVLSAGDTVRSLAVNPPAAESRLQTMTDEELAAALPDADLRLAGPGEWTDAIYHQRLGREVTRPVLASLLLILVLESGLAARGAARRPRASSKPNDS